MAAKDSLAIACPAWHLLPLGQLLVPKTHVSSTSNSTALGIGWTLLGAWLTAWLTPPLTPWLTWAVPRMLATATPSGPLRWQLQRPSDTLQAIFSGPWALPLYSASVASSAKSPPKSRSSSLPQHQIPTVYIPRTELYTPLSLHTYTVRMYIPLPSCSTLAPPSAPPTSAAPRASSHRLSAAKAPPTPWTTPPPRPARAPERPRSLPPCGGSLGGRSRGPGPEKRTESEDLGLSNSYTQ